MASAEEGNATSYAGAEKCGTCHKPIYESWNKTKHANAYDTMLYAYNMLTATGRGIRPWVEIGRTKEWCEQCHTTGRYANGTYVLKNIQCERCHLLGKEHIQAGGGKGTQKVDWSAELCRQCHGGSQHPQYDDWKQSAHSRSLAVACQQCHVAQFVVKSDFGSIKIEPVLENKEPINCQTCHDPHGSVNYRQLRYPPEELCAKCHNVKGPKIAGRIAHTQADMFNGSIMEQAGVTCYNCHMYVKVYESEISPRVTGHTFEPRPEQCVTSCHPKKDAKWAKSAVEVRQVQISALMTEVEKEVKILHDVISKKYPTWDGETKESVKGLSPHGSDAIDRYLRASYAIDFIKADKSTGFHNGEKATRMLEEAKTLTNEGMDSIRKEIAPTPQAGAEVTNLPKIVAIIVIVGGIILAISLEVYRRLKKGQK
ncbi:ammonia-forming cytochrome c nitrite reductase subunit c552 [Candidatus Woesearchaeota archaeon]|nr:ammonia-forming cytochrome c nitrite reductase subunit c552 [Candidatus Woesearchaeota archaeon]